MLCTAANTVGQGVWKEDPVTSTHARIARAVATAVVVFFLAAGAHVAGGAALPDPLILVGLGGLTLLTITIVARRKLTVGGTLVILGAGQVVLHEAFSNLSSTAACMPASGEHLGPQQVHCVPVDALGHVHGISLINDPLMAGMHMAAVAVTALMLVYGETALELALRWLRPLVAVPDVAASMFPLPDLPLPPVSPAGSYLSPLLDVRPLRGPPLSLGS